jgi:hypothetical protein
MLYLDDVSLPGHGDITGVFWSQDSRILAVTSVFRLLTEPPARATYGGHKLRYRVSLYLPPSRKPVAVFDHAAFPINDVAFHPTKPTVVIGAGSYDGGYLFEGQLVLWDWAASRSRSLRAIPEVVRVRFTNDAGDIEALVRPWDERCDERQIEKPFETFYRLTLKDGFAREWDDLTDQEVRDQIESRQPLDGHEASTLAHFERPIDDPFAEIKRAFEFESFQQRSPIWDVALLSPDAVGIVHDDCWLEVFSRQGERRHTFKGHGHGAQIFHAKEPLVHIVDTKNWLTACNTVLTRFSGSEVSEVVSLTGRYSFSMAQDGSVLGRRDRSFQQERASAEVDVILGSDLTTVTKHDLGHYDVFNHYLRIDRAPCLYVVQGTPRSSHEAKYLCTVTQDGRVERLWPLLKDAGDQASHAMECCFCFIHDDQGAGVIVSGKHFNSSTMASYSGFIYRKNLEGRELWRHATTASAASIKVVPNSGLVMAAFLDGNFAMIQGDNGEISHWGAFTSDENASIIFSLDVDETHVAFGTIDGRCGVKPLTQFMQTLFA